MKSHWFVRYILPGFIFQSMIIGGAYGSGKELAQFFLPYGPAGGLLGMAVTMLAFSAVIAVSFEFSRFFRQFEYRGFFRRLLGRGWVLFEILYVLLLILIISVIGATSGTLSEASFGIPATVGTIVMMAAIGIIVFYGTKAVERFLAFWSFALYGAYILFFSWNFAQFGGEIQANLANLPAADGWFQSGVRYAGYNLAILPAALFCVRHLTSRRDALSAGVLAGPIAMLPAALFFFAMIAHHGDLMAQGPDELPVSLILERLAGGGFFAIVFPVILFGTFIETGAGMIHGLNERVAAAYEEHAVHMPRALRPAIAIAVLLVSIVLADAIGLTNLIARGYGWITYGFILVYVIPVMSWGIWLLWQAKQEESGEAVAGEAESEVAVAAKADSPAE